MNRDEARAAGAKRYDGAPCGRCGSTTRYVSSCGCVDCDNDRNAARYYVPISRLKYAARSMRIRAMEAGHTKYDGMPCTKCNTTLRYTSNGGCVSCQKNRATRKREPLIWIHQPPCDYTAPLYAMCPTLAAYNGEWIVVYSGSQQDVFLRPAALQRMVEDKTHPGHAIASHLAPALTQTQRKGFMYEGMPCIKCGDTLRYTSSCGCVSCSKKKRTL